MGKPIGTYLTLEAPGMASPDEDYHREISEKLAEYLKELMGGQKNPSVLVVGLGNRDVTPGCAGTEDGFQPVDHKTSDPGVWSGSHGCGRML